MGGLGHRLDQLRCIRHSGSGSVLFLLRIPSHHALTGFPVAGNVSGWLSHLSLPKIRLNSSADFRKWPAAVTRKNPNSTKENMGSTDEEIFLRV